MVPDAQVIYRAVKVVTTRIATDEKVFRTRADRSRKVLGCIQRTVDINLHLGTIVGTRDVVPYACTHRCGRFHHTTSPAVHVELVAGIIHVGNQAVTSGKGDRLRLHRNHRIGSAGIHANPAFNGDAGGGVQACVIRDFYTVVSVEL